MDDTADENLEGDETGSQERAASGAPKSGWAVPNRFTASDIFERVLASAAEEVTADRQTLFFSGTTAGFAIVLTFVGHAVGAAMFPDDPFLSAVLYPVGFLYIILGRYQLYTENTLPPVALVLARRASLPLLTRVWWVVLVGNVVGAAVGAYLLAVGDVLSPAAVEAGLAFTETGIAHGWWTVFARAVFAGWLVAGVVWLDHAAQDTIARFLQIYVIFYMIAAAELYHVITAAGDAFFYLFVTGADPLAVFAAYWLPILLGNTIGGVLLFTLVNYAQTDPMKFSDAPLLTRREMLFSWRGGPETV